MAVVRYSPISANQEAPWMIPAATGKKPMEFMEWGSVLSGSVIARTIATKYPTSEAGFFARWAWRESCQRYAVFAFPSRMP